MALTYQALNGTVISKTTTIQGPDISKAGSPLFSLSIPKRENKYFTFSGFSSVTKTDYSINTISSGTSPNYAAPLYYVIGNNGEVGYSTDTNGSFSIYYNTGGESLGSKFTVTWVLIDKTTKEISIEERTLTLSSVNVYQSYILLAKPADGKYVVSLSFTFIE